MATINRYMAWATPVRCKHRLVDDSQNHMSSGSRKMHWEAERQNLSAADRAVTRAFISTASRSKARPKFGKPMTQQWNNRRPDVSIA